MIDAVFVIVIAKTILQRERDNEGVEVMLLRTAYHRSRKDITVEGLDENRNTQTTCLVLK